MMPDRTIFRIYHSSFKVALFVLWLYMGIWRPLLVSGVVAPKGSDLVLEATGAEPRAAVAEPNLGTLLGIGNPLGSTGNPAALLQAIGGAAGHPSLSGPPHGDVPSLQALRDSGALGAICNNAGNSDTLTNLLVYQYLSGSLPTGATSGGAQAALPRAVANPHLQALLEGTRESKTVTSVTTTQTTRTITMEASTKFSTSTTSYVTTVTSLTSSVLPIIFRGSKITTTITDRKTEVLTATEFHTSSSVLNPSIIQTLNVEITLTQTSTKGLNGLFTLAQVTPGPSKVHETPISSHSVGFEQLGLSNLDLRNLGKGDNSAHVLDAFAAILQKYHDEPAPEEEPDRNRGRGRPRGRERNQNRFGNTRFHNRPRENSAPKNNVIRGSTFRDQPAAEDDGNSGTALENTRYSKFRKKSNVDNNRLRSSDADRERERFSASTSRRTVSSTNRRQQTPPRSTGARATGVRSNRQTERSRRRSGRTLEANVEENNNINVTPPRKSVDVRTTLLTMHISGSKPGEVITTVRTVTLRGVGTERIKRQIKPEPTTISRPIASTSAPDQGFGLQPKDVVKLLKNLKKSTVRRMLYSLHGWVDYYLHQVLDEIIEPSFKFERLSDIETNEIPELYPSQIEEDLSSSQGETTALDSIPNDITIERDPVATSHSSSPNICPQVSVITETVYKTLYQADHH